MLQLPTGDQGSLQHDAAQATVEHEDEDLALARMLQEQEQMFLQLRGATQRRHAASASPDVAVAASLNTSAIASQGALYARRDATESSSDSASSSHDQSDNTTADDEDDDMEFARKLQEEEDRAHHERMLQMAGIGTHIADEEQYLSDDDVDPDGMTYEQLQALGDTVGVVSRGAAPDVMARLRKCTYAEHNTDYERCSEQCTVCCMELEPVDHVCVLDCKHCYHPECISEWLKHSKKCPVCHTEVAASCNSSTGEGVKKAAVSLAGSKHATGHST